MSQTQTVPVAPETAKQSSTPRPAAVLAEFAGSFLICFAIYAVTTYGTALYGQNLVLLTVGAALAYYAVTAMLGRISGGHFNPAVTLAAVLTSRIQPIEALLYVIAQVIGGLLAGAMTMYLLPTNDNVTGQVWFSSAVNGYGDASPSYSMISNAGISFDVTMAIIVEVVMGLLVVAASMATLREDGTADDSHALSVGAAYGIATAVAFPVTGAALNPVRATGIAVAAQGKGLDVEPLSQLWLFWVCPLLAGAVVALVMLLRLTLAQMLERKAAAKAAITIEETIVEEDVITPSDASDTESTASSETAEDVEATEDAPAADGTDAANEDPKPAETNR